MVPGRIPPVVSWLLCAALAAPLPAQVVPPSMGGRTTSMGLPNAWKFDVGALAGVQGPDAGEAAVYATIGTYRDLINPALQAVGFVAEAYGGRRGGGDSFGDGWDGGVRMGMMLPIARLAFGADYNIADRETDFLLSLIHPLARGGIFVDGGTVRLDWLPGRGSFFAGVRLPVGRRFVGQTRPSADRATQPAARLPEPAVKPVPGGTSDRARVLALWIDRLTIPYVDQWSADPGESRRAFFADMQEIADGLAQGVGGLPGPLHPEDVVRAFHTTMVHAFSAAVCPVVNPVGCTTAGIQAWDAARAVLLDQVLLPYNRLLGRRRAHDSALGYGVAALASFRDALDPMLDEGARDRAARVFAMLVRIADDVRAESRARWGDERLVFLPLQLALRPEDHDTQAEIDAIVERAVEGPFLPANRIDYVENEFALETARMILQARDHHVLWVHDYAGRNAAGEPDAVGFSLTVDAYLRALTDAVKAYDETGRIPQFIVFVDQWYYQAKSASLWLRLLEDPLHHEVRLGTGSAALEARIAAAQSELRAAVANSRLLQERSRAYGHGWIENVVKVHVNITNPADVTFWTDEAIPLVGVPDMIARDHRKVSFYDISEDDPYAGGALLTGMGIGEEYTGARWEDRSLLIRGPALLGLKAAARDLLASQGFAPDEIPWSLRPRPLGPGYAAAVERERHNANGMPTGTAASRVLGVHNEVGYAPKMVDVLKATLYTLMPPGSVIKAPDSLWSLPLWCSMLLGNALRGGRSLIIAPALAHAPSSGFHAQAGVHDVLVRAVLAPQVFADHLARTGGLLKVGLYNPPFGAGDTPARMDALLATLERTPWLRTLYGLPDGTLDAIGGLAEALVETGFYDALPASADSTSHLHIKAHFLATAEAWDGLLAGDAGRAFLIAYYRAIADQNAALAAGRRPPVELVTDAIVPAGLRLARERVEPLSPEGRARQALYLLVGSHNQNHRSFIMDGEVAFVVTGWQALHGLPDFLTLAGLATWVDDVPSLEALLPAYEGFERRLGRWLRLAV